MVTGKLGRAWVGAWVVHGMVHGWFVGGCGADVVGVGKKQWYTTRIGEVGLIFYFQENYFIAKQVCI